MKKYSHYFQHDNLLEITINNSKFSNPVGLASGFDKNCELLKPNSYIFGLVTAGTILRNINYGNKQDPKNNIKRLIINNNDKHILLASLGKILRKSLKDFAESPKPFIIPNSKIFLQYRNLLSSLKKIKIGISWKTIGVNNKERYNSTY